MIFANCLKLKELVARYNRKQFSEENWLRCEFEMFTVGEWSCTLSSKGCVSVDDFKEIYDFVATLYVAPFMYGSSYRFNVHIQ